MTPPLVRDIPPLFTPGTAAAALAVASSQLGYREGSNNDNIFGVEYGMRNAAWCAIFQHWVDLHSGCSSFQPKFAWTPAGADWYRERDQWGSKPRIGALGFVYSSSMGRIHHVFRVEKIIGAYVLTIEGNTNNTGSAQGNGVYRLRRYADLGRNGGYGYPKYKTAPLFNETTVSPNKTTAVWKLGDGFPGQKAFVVGKDHPAVPVTRRRLTACGFGRSLSTDRTWTEQDHVHTVAFQRSRARLKDDADGVLGPLGWQMLLRLSRAKRH